MALTDGLVALWHMNNDWLDSSGNGKNGTAYAGATFDTTNKKLGVAAGSFDGIDDYVSVPDNDVFDFGGSNFTISAWIYRRDNTTNHNIISKTDITVPLSGWVWSTGSTPSNTMYFVYGAGHIRLDSTKLLYENTWYHVVIRRSGGTLYFYADGLGAGSAAIGTITNITNQVLFASRQLTEAIGEFSKVFIDELAIWNRAITTDEIAQLYNSGNGMEIGAAANSGFFAIF